MKLLKTIISVAVIGSGFPLITTTPALAGCYPASAVADYKDYLSSTSKNNALRISLDENYDGTADCKVKINANFMKRVGFKPL